MQHQFVAPYDCGTEFVLEEQLIRQMNIRFDFDFSTHILVQLLIGIILQTSDSHISLSFSISE